MVGVHAHTRFHKIQSIGMIINTNSGTIDISVDDNSFRYRAIRGDNNLTLYFSNVGHIEIPVGSWTIFNGQRYELVQPENFKKRGSRNFEYTLILESEQASLRKYKYRDTTTRRLKFSYTAKPQEHIKMLVDNLNNRESGWAVGECVESSEKLITYNHIYCSDALNTIADTFNTEWEIIDKKIHLRKVEYNKNTPLPLSYGCGDGFLPGLGRMNFDDSCAVEVLFVQGSDRNIDPSKYGHSELLLPKSQILAYEGRVYQSDNDGFSIKRGDKALKTHAEESLDCSNIYPSRVGTVSSVTVDTAKNFWDFTDSSIPVGLDFTQYLIAGEKLTVMFQTGMLAGRGEFDVKYIHAQRKFEIVPQQIDGREMPDTVYKPVVGDKYAVFGMMLPDAYLCDNVSKTGASWDMYREAVKYLYEHEDERFSFTGELDGIWSKKDWANIGGKIKLGGYVLFTDSQFQPTGVLIRIIGVKEYINNPHSPIIELSNITIGGSVSGQLNKITENEALTEQRVEDLRRETRRRYADAKEMQELLEKALENFTSGIEPIWVRTMSVLIGNEYQQFEFVNSKTEPQSEVIPAFTMNNSTKVFTAPTSILKHLTMGIENTSSEYKVTDYTYWTVSALSQNVGSSPSVPLYLVAKCLKGGITGYFTLIKDYKYDPGDGYYYFLVGILSSEREGERSFATCYGYTEILPGQMRIKMIISPDGKTYFNVAQGEIGGRIVFTAGTTGYNNISDRPDIANQINTAINNFKDILDGIFADGIIDEAEARTIAMYLNTLALDKAQIDSDYDQLRVHPLLAATTYIVSLATVKSNLDIAYSSLVNFINYLVNKGIIETNDRTELNIRFGNYITLVGNYTKLREQIRQYIEQKIEGVTANALQTAQDASITAGGKGATYYTTVGNPNSPLYKPPGVTLKENDLLVNGVHIWRWSLTSPTANTWVLVSEYDRTQTAINGGLISTGAIVFGSNTNGYTGGMTGYGDIRIWSGADYVYYGSQAAEDGTFRVHRNGNVWSSASMYARGAFYAGVESASTPIMTNGFFTLDINGLIDGGFTNAGGTTTSFGTKRFWIGGGGANVARAWIGSGGDAQFANITSKAAAASSTSQILVFTYGGNNAVELNNSGIIINSPSDVGGKPSIVINSKWGVGSEPTIMLKGNTDNTPILSLETNEKGTPSPGGTPMFEVSGRKYTGQFYFTTFIRAAWMPQMANLTAVWASAGSTGTGALRYDNYSGTIYVQY